MEYKIVYKNDKEGNTVLGSKQQLIDYIRGGADIKIGWGSKGKTRRIEHLSEPRWLAVLNESEVTVHLDPQVFSRVDWNTLTASYVDSTFTNREWRVVLTTKGDFDAIWMDRNTKEVLRRVPQKHSMTWFARGTARKEPFFMK